MADDLSKYGTIAAPSGAAAPGGEPGGDFSQYGSVTPPVPQSTGLSTLDRVRNVVATMNPFTFKPGNPNDVSWKQRGTFEFPRSIMPYMTAASLLEPGVALAENPAPIVNLAKSIVSGFKAGAPQTLKGTAQVLGAIGAEKAGELIDDPYYLRHIAAWSLGFPGAKNIASGISSGAKAFGKSLSPPTIMDLLRSSSTDARSLPPLRAVNVARPELIPPPNFSPATDVSLPSGRQVGSIANQTPLPPPLPPLKPVNVARPQIPAPAEFSPATGVTLPSGRKVGGIANQTSGPVAAGASQAPATAAAFVTRTGERITLDDVAAQFKKPYAKLGPAEQKTALAQFNTLKQSEGVPTLTPPPGMEGVSFESPVDTSQVVPMSQADIKAEYARVNRDAHANAKDIFGDKLGHGILHDALQKAYGVNSWGMATLAQRNALNEFMQSNNAALSKMSPGDAVNMIVSGIKGGNK